MDARTATSTGTEDPAGGTTVVAAMSGSIQDMKALRDRCLEAGIEAVVGCPPGAGKG